MGERKTTKNETRVSQSIAFQKALTKSYYIAKENSLRPATTNLFKQNFTPIVLPSRNKNYYGLAISKPDELTSSKQRKRRVSAYRGSRDISFQNQYNPKAVLETTLGMLRTSDSSGTEDSYLLRRTETRTRSPASMRVSCNKSPQNGKHYLSLSSKH